MWRCLGSLQHPRSGSQAIGRDAYGMPWMEPVSYLASARLPVNRLVSVIFTMLLFPR